MEKNKENNLNDNNLINKVNKNKNKENNSFITFIEEYYGYFKQFILFKDLYNIGKVNRKIMSLFLIDKGNNLIHKKELKINKLKRIVLMNKKDENIKEKTSVKLFLNSKNMKQIFIYLKRRQYIEAFKSLEPTVDEKMIEIYKLFFIILKDEKMVDLYEASIEKFWKKMTNDLVRKSFDGENLSNYIYNILLNGLNFDIEHILKINYIWKNYYYKKFDIKEITIESPTTGIFLLIIKEYLEYCGIIESDNNEPFYTSAIIKNDILNINKQLLDISNFFIKINNI